MDKQILKQILRDNQQEVERYMVEPRHSRLNDYLRKLRQITKRNSAK